ncbi:hypothetical protein JCM10450v2_004461 [Rhodotorula kratochvilovae]
MPAPTPDPKTPAASTPQPRVIPGLSVPTQAPTAPKPRKRGSKHKVTPSGTFDAASPGEGPAADAPVPIPEQPQEEELVVEEKKTNAVEACQKRIRSITKKLQRIEGYESSTGTLNADQQRAIAGKGTLEAVARELNELLVVLKAEEVEDDERNKRVAVVEEKKQARAIDAAVQASKAEAQQHLVLLFQFLHLHGLYNPSQTSFAPPVLPPIIASATGSDVACIRMLFDAFTNGPLLGGNDDALEKLSKIANGSDEEVLPGTDVSYKRVKQLIHGLTAGPEDAPAAPEGDAPRTNEDIEDLVAQSNEPAGKADSVVALVDGATEAVHPPPPVAPQVSFLQPSEVDAGQSRAAEVATPPAEEKVQHWAHDIALEVQAPPSGPSTPAPDATFGSSAASSPSTSVPPTPTSLVAPAPTSNGVPPAPEQPQPRQDAPTLDWAADDNDEGLPHLDELAPPVPVVSLPPSQPQQSSGGDGFQPARGARRGGGEHRGGPPRGGFRGRGSFRGRGRGGGAGGVNGEGRSESFQREGGAPADPSQQQRAPRPPRADPGESGEWTRGAGRGGRGRGGPRGGRGGRGGANGAGGAGGAPSPAPAPAPAAPSS